MITPKRVYRISLAFMAVLATSGCVSGSVFDNDAPYAASPGSLSEGILYGLPQQYLKLTIKRTRKEEDGKKSCELSMTVADDRLTVADPDYMFYLPYEYEASSDTQLRVEVNPAGLLTSVKTTTTDATPRAIRRVADLLASAATQGFAGISTDEKSTRRVVRECRPFDYTTFVAPGSNISMLQTHLKEIGGFSDFKIEPLIGSAEESVTAPVDSGEVAAACSARICYRAAMPYRITIEDASQEVDGNNESLLIVQSDKRAEIVVSVPNGGPIGSIDVRRRALITNTFNLTFKDGMLETYDINDPSAVAELAAIPIDVAKAVVSVPGSLLQLRFGADTSDEKLAREQKLLATEQRLLDARKDLLDRQNALFEKERAFEELQRSREN